MSSGDSSGASIGRQAAASKGKRQLRDVFIFIVDLFDHFIRISNTKPVADAEAVAPVDARQLCRTIFRKSTSFFVLNLAKPQPSVSLIFIVFDHELHIVKIPRKHVPILIFRLLVPHHLPDLRAVGLRVDVIFLYGLRLAISFP